MDYINQVGNAVPKGVLVTTADVHSKLIDSPQVIDACDLLLANFYPYWDEIDISQSMAMLHAAYQNLDVAAKGKKIMVSETGWPSEGDPKVDAVPTPANAAAYFINFISWSKKEGIDYFYFEALDEPWKSAYEGPQGAHWGIFEKTGLLKTGMRAVFDGKTAPDIWSCVLMPGGEGTPSISFTDVPKIGSNDNLIGRVLHVRPEDYRVAIFIKVAGGWWTKPSFSMPSVNISCEGDWVCDITTGGPDNLATEIAAYLVPAGYSPPSAIGGELPTGELETNAIAHLIITR